MTSIRRNDLSIYNRVADQWWSDEVRWVRTLKNLVQAALLGSTATLIGRPKTFLISDALAASWPRHWPARGRE